MFIGPFASAALAFNGFTFLQYPPPALLSPGLVYYYIHDWKDTLLHQPENIMMFV